MRIIALRCDPRMSSQTWIRANQGAPVEVGRGGKALMTGVDVIIALSGVKGDFRDYGF